MSSKKYRQSIAMYPFLKIEKSENHSTLLCSMHTHLHSIGIVVSHWLQDHCACADICSVSVAIDFTNTVRCDYANKSMTMWAPTVIFEGVSLTLKGQSNKIFDLKFFLSFEPVWATDQWFKIFLILVQISRSYSKFRLKKLTPQGMIPRG